VRQAFAVHSGPERRGTRSTPVPTERDLYDSYLPQFERRCAKAASAR